MCQNRKCANKGKSIRRDVLEQDFEALLARVTPEKPLVTVAEHMFRRLWDHLALSQASRTQHLKKEIAETGQQIDLLLDRIVGAQSPRVIQAFEKRIDELEKKRIILQEKQAGCGQTVSDL